MKNTIKLITLPFIFAAMVMVSGCQKDAGDHLEDAGESISEAAESAGDSIGDAADDAADEVKDATN
ncbi:MAG: hypothetical protein ACQKBV_10515 [Puniceicoccales bacterium]